MSNLYKFYKEVETEEEQRALSLELRATGVDMFDIYFGNYWGNDGKFHRTVFIFNR